MDCLISLADVKPVDLTPLYKHFHGLKPFLVSNFNYSQDKKPKTADEKKWYQQHMEQLFQCLETGKCLCGATIDFNNPLHNLGWEYGLECGECR